MSASPCLVSVDVVYDPLEFTKRAVTRVVYWTTVYMSIFSDRAFRPITFSSPNTSLRLRLGAAGPVMLPVALHFENSGR